MGIPVDYKDSDYEGKVPLTPIMSMLPLTKEQLALQECVGGKNDPTVSKDRLIQKSKSPVAVPQAPIKIVDGHHWSPGIYRTQRLLGKTLEVAWEGAFV